LQNRCTCAQLPLRRNTQLARVQQQDGREKFQF
jgi:hypothetical protein